ncbi:MAG: hypothetical protein WBX25_02010 [Rhodomicrobium sp.]
MMMGVIFAAMAMGVEPARVSLHEIAARVMIGAVAARVPMYVMPSSVGPSYEAHYEGGALRFKPPKRRRKRFQPDANRDR